MKPFIKTIAIAAIAALAVPAFAQSASQPKTRAQVREELIQMEHAGYNPSRVAPNDYPFAAQAAEARIAAQNRAMGGVDSGTSQQGLPAQQAQ